MKKSSMQKWLMIVVMLPLVAVAVSGCAGWRAQRALQRGAADARRELMKKYDLTSLDVRMTENMGRITPAVFVTYNTKQQVNSPERWMENRDILRICLESFKGQFGFVQLTTRLMDRTGRQVAQSATIVANPHEITVVLKTTFKPSKAELAWPQGR